MSIFVPKGYSVAAEEMNEFKNEMRKEFTIFCEEIETQLISLRKLLDESCRERVYLENKVNSQINLVNNLQNVIAKCYKKDDMKNLMRYIKVLIKEEIKKQENK
jgi:hypothetical protein